MVEPRRVRAPPLVAGHDPVSGRADWALVASRSRAGLGTHLGRPLIRRRKLLGGRLVAAAFGDPARHQRRVCACLDAQLGDLQLDRRVAVVLVESHGQACMLG